MNMAIADSEEMQRTMQFLLDQRAQFAADFANSQAQFNKMSEGLIGLTAIVGRVVDSVGEIAEAQKRSDARMDDLGEYIKTVEAHLNIVIEMFERHLREDHGHRPS